MAQGVAWLGVSTGSRQRWKALFSISEVARIRVASLTAELQRMKKGLARATEGTPPENGRQVLCARIPEKEPSGVVDGSGRYCCVDQL